jgi:hypothetical protein
MLAARWRMPIITVTITIGTLGALITSITGALAAHPAHSARYAFAARPQAVLKFAPSQAAPLVTDAVGKPKSKRGQAAPPMSQAMLTADALRQRAALSYLRQAHPPAAKYLAQTQQAQVRSNFCGPATVTEMLAQLGVKLSQTAAAKQLGTDGSGTDWSNDRGYPVARVLDANQKKNNYVAVGLPWTPNGGEVRTYESDLVTDLNRSGGVPLAGNAYEVPGGPHLIGHPVGQEIMHWFDIRGYSQGGAVTAYEDSVHGAPSVAWNSSVPAYSTLPSATIVYILGARGYIW